MNNEKIVAVKIINKKKENTTIKLEIDIMKKLNNKENIIQLIDFYENEDSYYIIMELCDCDLSQYLKENYPLTIDLIQNIMQQIIKGYNNLYLKDFLHLDLKLQNILVIYNNKNDKKNITIKISDFGLVHQNNIRIYLDKKIGTSIYMSPEIIEKKEYSNKADIYSIGLIAYKLATNKYPFKNSKDRYLKEKLNINFDKIKENIKNDILFDFIKGCLEPNVNLRYQFENILESPLLCKKIKKEEKKKSEDEIQKEVEKLNFIEEKKIVKLQYQPFIHEIKCDFYIFFNKNNDENENYIAYYSDYKLYICKINFKDLHIIQIINYIYVK